jgi:hypothetical protein
MRLKTGLLVLLSSVVSVNSFTVPIQSRGSLKSLRMAEIDQDGANIKSVKKQIVYDDKTGRFFESNRDEADCIPDEEFCVVDKESGTMIRLTVEEKERIFLDALQVRIGRCSRWGISLACRPVDSQLLSPLVFIRPTTSTTGKCLTTRNSTY